MNANIRIAPDLIHLHHAGLVCFGFYRWVPPGLTNILGETLASFHKGVPVLDAVFAGSSEILLFGLHDDFKCHSNCQCWIMLFVMGALGLPPSLKLELLTVHGGVPVAGVGRVEARAGLLHHSTRHCRDKVTFCYSPPSPLIMQKMCILFCTYRCIYTACSV